MIWTVELDAVCEHQLHVRDELVHGLVSRVVWIRVRFHGIRKIEFLFNCREIHRVSHNFRIMGNVHGYNVDGKQERSCVFRFFQVPQG